MRRKCLLSAAMLSALLATSACAAGSPDPVASPHSARLAGSGAGGGSSGQPQIGISQWNAAEAARKAKTTPATAAKEVPAAKAKPAAAKPEPVATTTPATAAKAKSAEKAAAAANAAAANAAAAEKAAAAAAAKEAAAKKKAAAAKTRPAAGAPKRVVPVPVTPKTSPTAVPQGPAEELVGSACEEAQTLADTLKGSVKVTDPALPGIGVETGTDAGKVGEFRCLD